MSTEPTGLGGALADRGAAAPDLEPELSFFPSIEQLDNLPRTRGGRYGREELRNLRRHGERGRPPGSRNKRNVKFAQYFTQKFGDPLDVMGEIMAMPLDALLEHMEAAQGGDAKHKPVRAIDGIRLKLEAANLAAPYVRGKQPISVEVTDRKDMVLLVPGLNVSAEHDVETMRAAVEEHGLAAIDFETQELVLLPTNRTLAPIPEEEDGDDA